MEKRQNDFQDFVKWVETNLPANLHALAKAYPPNTYRIKQGAPYGISCPGTMVRIYSYHDNGEISVIVKASNKLPQALQHESQLGKQYNRTPEEMANIHKADVVVQIDPKWIAPAFDINAN